MLSSFDILVLHHVRVGLNIFYSSQDMIKDRAERKAMFNPLHISVIKIECDVFQVPSCEDCETSLAGEGDGVFICSKCEKRRGERKDIIQEIVDSETSYGQDLHIIQQVETREQIE